MAAGSEGGLRHLVPRRLPLQVRALLRRPVGFFHMKASRGDDQEDSDLDAVWGLES